MITCRELTETPTWASRTKPVRLSQLLKLLYDIRVNHVSVRLVQGTAYIAVAKKVGIVLHKSSPAPRVFHYLNIPHKLWTIVNHIIITSPYMCRPTCDFCCWRIRHGRFLRPNDFDHLYETETGEE